MNNPLYNAVSHAQLQAYSITRNAIRSALERLAEKYPKLSRRYTNDPTPLRVQDLGCGPGSTAITFGENVLGQIRKELKFGKDLPVRWNFVDLPSNDWSSLLQMVSESDAFSSSEANVFAYAHGADFYGSCSPPESVHLSASMIALHWLSGTEVPGASLAGLDRVHPNEPGVPAETRAAFANKAHADLSQFLQKRTQELVPGGEGIYVMVGGDGPNDWRDKDGASLFTHALRKTIDKRLIPASVLEDAQINYYLRSEEEIRRTASEVEGLDILDIKSYTIHTGVNVPDQDAAQVCADLAWSVHVNSLRDSTGCSEAELDAIYEELVSVCKRYGFFFGTFTRRPKATFAMLAVRKHDE